MEALGEQEGSNTFGAWQQIQEGHPTGDGN